MKERPILFSGSMVRAILDGRKTQTRRVVKKQPHGAGEWVLRGINWLFPNINPYLNIKSPYGQPVDRLWVRETFTELHEGYAYKATCPDYNSQYAKWKPSIHMPRAASRINLEIVSVRIERLQDIDEADCQREGISEGVDYSKGITYKMLYQNLWESINGPGSWDLNPFVWVVEFRRIK